MRLWHRMGTHICLRLGARGRSRSCNEVERRTGILLELSKGRGIERRIGTVWVLLNFYLQSVALFFTL
jgi:hypothetical protein